MTGATIATPQVGSTPASKALRSHQILDPFEVDDAWFELLLPSLQLVVSDATPEAKRERAEFVLTRLRLRDDERVIRQRRAWLGMYELGELTLSGLERKAPQLARAIRKRDGQGD